MASSSYVIQRKPSPPYERRGFPTTSSRPNATPRSDRDDGWRRDRSSHHNHTRRQEGSLSSRKRPRTGNRYESDKSELRRREMQQQQRPSTSHSPAAAAAPSWRSSSDQHSPRPSLSSSKETANNMCNTMTRNESNSAPRFQKNRWGENTREHYDTERRRYTQDRRPTSNYSRDRRWEGTTERDYASERARQRHQDQRFRRETYKESNSYPKQYRNNQGREPRFRQNDREEFQSREYSRSFEQRRYDNNNEYESKRFSEHGRSGEQQRNTYQDRDQLANRQRRDFKPSFRSRDYSSGNPYSDRTQGYRRPDTTRTTTSNRNEDFSGRTTPRQNNAKHSLEQSNSNTTPRVPTPPSKRLCMETNNSKPPVSVTSTTMQQNTTSATEKTTIKTHPEKKAEAPAKASSLGIPMRWLKPAAKPKPVKKPAPPTSTQTKPTKEEPSKQEAPQSPSINRMVTDSEGGSTVSNSRDLQALVAAADKKTKVPTAIVTKPKTKMEEVFMGSPTDLEEESKDGLEMKPAKEKMHLAEEEEPPLASDSSASSSEDSDTDEEEVMMWASKMFGVSIPTRPPTQQQSQATAAPSKPLKLRLKLSPSPKKAKKATKAQTTKQQQQVKRGKKTLPQKVPKLAVRGRKKQKKTIVRPPSVETTPEQRELEEERERQERAEEKRIREEAKPLTAAQIRAILGEDDAMMSSSQTNWVRRSVRQPSRALLNSKPLKALVEGLKGNYADMVVLKMKKYINDPNAPAVVLDAALEALEENTNCEALYIQNFNEGLRDKQVLHLLKILQSPRCNIWCLNIGENYNVATETWEKFTKGLRKTRITHMYASEHTITTEMKDEIRETIRLNRKKHDRHINPNNLHVIVQCTHCWWNPINAKSLRPYLKKQGFEHMLTDKEAQGLRGSTSEAPSA